MLNNTTITAAVVAGSLALSSVAIAGEGHVLPAQDSC